MMKKNIFIENINGNITSRPPVWFMRQAGRILPSYLKLKQNYSFDEMMQNKELAAKVTLLPSLYDHPMHWSCSNAGCSE